MDQMLWDARWYWSVTVLIFVMYRQTFQGVTSQPHIISGYHRVFAFDIDVNNTISNLTIEGMIKPMAGGVYMGK